MIDVDRGPQPPTEYGTPAFREHLHSVFFGKCYLTERPVETTDFEIDHRIPRAAGGSDAWENLFPAHNKANAHRARAVPDGGYASPGEGVERRLTQSLRTSLHEVRCVFSANDPEDRAAANTAAELNQLHNEVPWGRDLRDAIERSLLDVLKLIIAFKEATGPHREQVRAELRMRLSRRAPFTALLRAAVADYADVASLFD